MFFGDDLAVQLVLFALLLGQQHVTPFLEMGEAPFDASRATAVEPNRRARQVREKAPVVTDDHEGRAPGVEVALQPFDGGEIQVIGWLIEQKDVGGGRQHARERGAACFAAGKAGRMFSTCESQLLEEIAGRMVVVARDAIGFDISQRRVEAGEIWLLRQVAHQGTRLHENRAAIGLYQPGRNFQQGRFARAVTADEAHPLSSADREFRTGKQGRAAESKGNVFELQKGRSHFT